MNRHPGGEEHTRRLLALAALPPGARVLDLGAGEGAAVALLRSLGYEAEGLDLAPRSDSVRAGDLLHAPYPDGSFDAVLSECAFFVSGDQRGAVYEAARLLKAGGKLLLADVFFAPPREVLAGTGLTILAQEERTAAWKEYYIEALWAGTAADCPAPKGKCSYYLLVARKGEENGSA